MNGYAYFHEYDTDEDCRKILHTVVTPKGEYLPIPWSSYEHMDDEDFRLWIQLGMPQNPPRGTNFTKQLLIEYLNSTMTI